MGTRLNYETSVQVTYLQDVTVGKEGFKLPNNEVFLIKNIGDNNVSATIELPSMNGSIKTVLYPGWNVELCTKIVSVDDSNAKLQIGY